MNATQVKLDALDAKLDTVVQAVSMLREDLSTTKNNVAVLRGDVLELREDLSTTKNNVAELRGGVFELREDLSTTRKELSDFRREAATKLDIAELRQHIGAFRQENQREHLELYRILREEMYERFIRLDPGVDPA